MPWYDWITPAFRVEILSLESRVSKLEATLGTTVNTVASFKAAIAALVGQEKALEDKEKALEAKETADIGTIKAAIQALKDKLASGQTITLESAEKTESENPIAAQTQITNRINTPQIYKKHVVGINEY